jgi:2-polyprenyl-6-methoxyphenol hydroxylase-like FAD-dependent oxidoreductase
VDEKEPLQARLVVVASGRSATLLSQLGIRKQMLSASHSMAFGFSIRASRGGRFGFQELLYRADHTASRIAFVSLFRIGDTMRVNMFTYWDAQESHCRWLIDDTHACLNEIVPELTRRTGQFEVVSRVDRCPGHLQRVEGHLQPGIVLVGDAYQTNCPATGTGITKLLNDAECLCNRHIPEWFATPGMPIEKVARYYSDPRKMAYDSESLSEAIAMRRLALDSSLRGQWRRLARGWKRSVCQWWQPSSTGAIPVGHS